jgi:hypothetical protein
MLLNMEAMPTKKKRGPVKRSERERYQALIADDAEWQRPELTTAKKVCELVGADPFAFRAPRVLDNADAAQAFVVALDYLIQLGDRAPDSEDGGAQLLWNGIFDAVARHWSLSYRDAQQRGALATYNMTKPTIRAAWREMRWSGFDLEAIWKLLVHPTGALAQLYTVGRVSGKGHARGRRVALIEGQLLDDVRYAILQDRQYSRPDRRRLLLADEEAPPLPTRQVMSEERPYETVALGERSRRVLSLLEGARVRFYLDRFRQDYEADPDPAWRLIYEQTAGLVPEIEFGFDTPGRGFVEIRSRFFRAVNRRFHAADFWPEHVPDALRTRWFGIAPNLLDVNKGRPVRIGEAIDDLRVSDTLASAFVERDISSSQTQLLAVFLNEPDLEGLACDPTKKFKVWLAEQLWAFHKRENVLAAGYKAPNDDGRPDDCLIAFIKELWMRRNYGGKFSQTVRDLAKAENRGTYGPGWNVDVFKTGGIKRAEHYWRRFLDSLPEWERTVDKFLMACQHLGRDADWHYGIRFDDPLDGSEIKWNPIRLATDRVPTGKRHIEILRPGVMIRRRARDGRYVRRFMWRDPYVDGAKLANRIAPCVVHTLDAFFNALVLEDLHWEGETNVVAIHDSWLVPLVYLVPESGYTQHRLGSELVARCIEYAGRPWLEGIGSVYGWFVDATLGTPYRRFARELRRAWCKRVAEKRWPKFTAS